MQSITTLDEGQVYFPKDDDRFFIQISKGGDACVFIGNLAEATDDPFVDANFAFRVVVNELSIKNRCNIGPVLPLHPEARLYSKYYSFDDQNEAYQVVSLKDLENWVSSDQSTAMGYEQLRTWEIPHISWRLDGKIF